MRVQFDLRTATLLEKERKKTSFNLIRTLAILLLFLFFVSSGAYIGLMAWNMVSLIDSVDNKRDEVESMEGQKMALEAEIVRLKGQEAVYASTLKIMQDDLPTIEALNALENNVDYGMRLESVKFAVGQPSGASSLLTVEASAATEDQIVQFSDGLTESGVFSQVRMPSSKLDEKTGRVSFTLTLSLLPIGQINTGAR